MNFDHAFNLLINHEGGYVFDPRDPGGETKFGISKRAYPNVDIRNLTLADAKAIYKRDYWDRAQCDRLPPDLAFDLFDAAVNSGIGQAIRWLQRSVGVADDGVVGPLTLAAIQRLDDTRATRGGVPGESAAACAQRADAGADVLGQCAAAYLDLAAIADRHANDARTLIEAWPK